MQSSCSFLNFETPRLINLKLQMNQRVEKYTETLQGTSDSLIIKQQLIIKLVFHEINYNNLM